MKREIWILRAVDESGRVLAESKAAWERGTGVAGCETVFKISPEEREQLRRQLCQKLSNP